MTKRLIIPRGADKSFIAVLRNSAGDPISLANAVLIQVVFDNADRTKLTLSNVVKPETFASILYGGVRFTAITSGITGNAIVLAFDGVATITAVVLAWNTANPSNTISHNGVGTVVLSLGSAQLTNGYSSYSPIAIYGNVILGKIRVVITETEASLLKAGLNQSARFIIDDGINTGGIRAIGFLAGLVDVTA